MCRHSIYKPPEWYTVLTLRERPASGRTAQHGARATGANRTCGQSVFPTNGRVVSQRKSSTGRHTLSHDLWRSVHDVRLEERGGAYKILGAYPTGPSPNHCRPRTRSNRADRRFSRCVTTVWSTVPSRSSGRERWAGLPLCLLGVEHERVEELLSLALVRSFLLGSLPLDEAVRRPYRPAISCANQPYRDFPWPLCRQHPGASLSFDRSHRRLATAIITTYRDNVTCRSGDGCSDDATS